MATATINRGSRATARLKAARQTAEAEGLGHATALLISPAVMVTYSRPVEERDAATEYVRGQEAFADEWTEEGPVWLGWQVHAAFLAGVDFSRRHDEP